MRVIIIGTGNVAHVLGRLCKDAGHEIIQVFGRNKALAEQLAEKLQSGHASIPGQVNQSGDLYIIAVTDTAIHELASSMYLDKKMVVHTAGSVSKEVLQPVSKNYGVLYPLQSLRREMTTFPEIPFLVDGNTPDDLSLVTDFARTLSNKVQMANDEQRLKLHVAAVMVSNFTNHLYALAEQYCREEKVDFRLLTPLITAIAQQVNRFSPKEVQTGPAVRHDSLTIEKHLSMLNNHQALKELYAQFTKSIQEMHE